MVGSTFCLNDYEPLSIHNPSARIAAHHRHSVVSAIVDGYSQISLFCEAVSDMPCSSVVGIENFVSLHLFVQFDETKRRVSHQSTQSNMYGVSEAMRPGAGT